MLEKLLSCQNHADTNRGFNGYYDIYDYSV